ncbi:uncharacterized protein LOC143645692 [Tamandua tetradactyla]|uniref:uncharacterized protein LOC143645692 n=1 Tax=Tamandua tetradactyla TaxID=48850 RepID=UPI00405381AA
MAPPPPPRAGPGEASLPRALKDCLAAALTREAPRAAATAAGEQTRRAPRATGRPASSRPRTPATCRCGIRPALKPPLPAPAPPTGSAPRSPLGRESRREAVTSPVRAASPGRGSAGLLGPGAREKPAGRKLTSGLLGSPYDTMSLSPRNSDLLRLGCYCGTWAACERIVMGSLPSWVKQVTPAISGHLSLRSWHWTALCPFSLGKGKKNQEAGKGDRTKAGAMGEGHLVPHL